MAADWDSYRPDWGVLNQRPQMPEWRMEQLEQMWIDKDGGMTFEEFVEDLRKQYEFEDEWNLPITKG